jgi:hypothetical protein
MTENYVPERPRSAVVVFHGKGFGPWSPILKEGFKHCLVLVEVGDYWVKIDGMAGVPSIEVFAPGGYDIAGYYRDEGYTVIKTTQNDLPPRSPFAIANCVGVVKATLCIRAPFAVTPWRLYKHLDKKMTLMARLSGFLRFPGGGLFGGGSSPAAPAPAPVPTQRWSDTRTPVDGDRRKRDERKKARERKRQMFDNDGEDAAGESAADSNFGGDDDVDV